MSTPGRPTYERTRLHDKPREACGIFGICGHTEAAAVTADFQKAWAKADVSIATSRL